MREDEIRPTIPDVGRRKDEDELSLYGDEQDAPLRRRRRPSHPAKKKKKRGHRAPVKRKRRKRRSFFEWLFAGTAPRKRTSGLRLFGKDIRLSFWPTFLIVAALLIVSVVFLQSTNITVDEEKVTLVGLPGNLEGYRILHISDLAGKRFGDGQATILREIGTLDYDCVLLTGDMVGKGGDPEPFYELLEGLPSRKPVYFIAGDSDPGPVRKAAREITGTVEEMVLEDWVLGAVERGATYVDAPVRLAVGDSVVWITPADMLNLNASEMVATCKAQMEQEQEGTVLGLQADYDTLPATTYRFERATRLLDAVNRMSETDVHLSLAHEPPSDAFLRASASHDTPDEKFLTQPSIVLAGHYCGGVWRLPFLGAFYIPSATADRHGWLPAQQDVKGLSAVSETHLYITAGLSTPGSAPFMAFRMLNSPEISVIELTATLPESMLER
ncbi:MAG: metallophosphoesterase [Clostridiales bacterium]|nr:metallophosphoesterase [Clostridiales bacterium]